MSVKKRMLAVSKSRGFQCKVKLLVYGFDKMHFGTFPAGRLRPMLYELSQLEKA
jgi:hypothetical protein